MPTEVIQRNKLGQFQKGQKFPEEWIRKSSESHKGKPSGMLGKKHPKEWSRKMSKIMKGKNTYPRSERQKETLRKLRLGMIPWNKGKKGIYSKEARRKMSLAQKGKYLGKNHPNWRGGISFEPYSIDWTKTLKRAIRERDKYTCQICGEELATEVHHIDYDKKNCNPDNLITLCASCHSKTNFNRNYWINHFS